MFLAFQLSSPEPANSQQIYDRSTLKNSPKSDVFFQGFYWNSPPGGIWWDSLARLAPRLASAGFSGIWFPPPEKGYGGGYSMGYDPYDHYDFGEFNQYGGVETRFGSRAELVHSIEAFHEVGMQVFADAVMGHMNGGEQKVPFACEPYPSYPDSGYLVFNYPNGSGRFKKNASHFYPNLQTCDVNPPYHGPSDPIFKFGEVLAHAQSHVKDSLIVWGQYLRDVLGFDGFRLDAVKHIDPVFVGPWIQQAAGGGYTFAEYYGSMEEIKTWLHYCQNVFGGDVSMLDFPLRFDLQSMCNNTGGTYDMTWLDGAGLVNNGVNGYDVATFVENHDLDRVGWDGNIDNGHNPIISNKEMAYAYTIFSEGRPCVWFRDYFAYGLAGRIDTLIWIRMKHLGGGTTKRGGINAYYERQDGSTDQGQLAQDIYVARRDGFGSQTGGYLVMNDNPSQWIDVWVDTEFPVGTVYRDFTGKDADKVVVGPAPGGSKNRVKLWCPPRAYTVYAADTAQALNHPPYVQLIPAQTGFINTPFSYQLAYGDPNGDSVSFSLSGAPSWLSISASGLLNGTPGPGDTLPATIILTAEDLLGASVSDTFDLTVLNHPLLDGVFEGSSLWGAARGIADNAQGWDSTNARELYITSDATYYYLGAKVKARDWANWVFLINTKPGGGGSDSWSRSILYNHPNKPDYVVRGYFTGYAERHTWTGSAWSGVGTPLSVSDYADNISGSTSQEGWVEVRIPRSAIGNPQVLQVQFYVTGNQNVQATFDAIPNDQNTTTWSGLTTQLRYYTVSGPKLLTDVNLQFPSTVELTNTGSATVYARTFGVGITDSAGVGAGVQAWIGYSTTNTNPSTWTNWIPALYNVDANQYDEYRATLGNPTITPGSYYYASRFQYSGGGYSYGGYSASGGGVWNGTTNISGTLRMYALPTQPVLNFPPNDTLDLLSAVTFGWDAVADAQTYRLQVATDSNFSAIIFNDSTITATNKNVNGLPFGQRLYWRVRAKNISGTSVYSIVRTFTTLDASISQYPINQKWNMLSLAVNPTSYLKSQLYPNAVSNAFEFSTSGGYVAKDTISHSKGYWLKFPTAETLSILGTPRMLDTMHLEEGWNMIGSISVPVPINAIIQQPDSILSSPFFGYDGGYVRPDTIMPGQSYWVKSEQSGILILEAPSGSQFPQGVQSRTYRRIPK